MGQEGREGMGWRGQDEDRDGTRGKGWDGGDRDGAATPSQLCPARGDTPDAEPPRRGRAGAGALMGLGGTGDIVGTPGWGRGPSVGHCAFQRRWLSGDPQPKDPRPGWSWVPPSSAPRWRPRAGCSPLRRVGARPRTLPACTHAHTHTHAHTRAGMCTGPQSWGAGQGTGEPGHPQPVTPRCAPDPPAEAHAGHALPALRALFPR